MYHKETFPNGIKVVIEEIPSVHSVSIGVWVSVGSRDEKAKENGTSHFLEHMIFKGTKSKTALAIAQTMDSIGGHVDAATGREHTCYYAKVLDKHLPTTIELLADIFFNSVFNPIEISKEKQVIIEEIKMYEDTPDELIHDLFAQTIWKNYSLGQPIWGNLNVIKETTQDKLINFWNTHYTPGEIVISVAGHIQKDEVVNQLFKFFSQHTGSNWRAKETVPVFNSNSIFQFRKLEQIHLCLGTPGLSSVDEDRYILRILTTILGVGMSSRLFQKIREESALAYNVHAYPLSYKNAGALVVYAGVSPKNYKETTRIILDEFNTLKTELVSEQELLNAKEKLKSALWLNSEDTSYRMSRLAEQEIYFHKLFSIEETLELIDKVNSTDIKRLAQELFKNEYLCLTTIGPLRKQELGVRG
ncbi:MAG: pitrilysin family protein [bacterium]|nr:pitrilysin family protein [bacterium]